MDGKFGNIPTDSISFKKIFLFEKRIFENFSISKSNVMCAKSVQVLL
jgi:hypothetical protein